MSPYAGSHEVEINGNMPVEILHKLLGQAAETACRSIVQPEGCRFGCDRSSSKTSIDRWSHHLNRFMSWIQIQTECCGFDESNNCPIPTRIESETFRQTGHEPPSSSAQHFSPFLSIPRFQQTRGLRQNFSKNVVRRLGRDEGTTTPFCFVMWLAIS